MFWYLFVDDDVVMMMVLCKWQLLYDHQRKPCVFDVLNEMGSCWFTS